MKKLTFIIILMLVSLTAVFAKPAKYEGSWTLDVKQSKNLPPYYENIKSHKLFITQDEKVLNVAVEIDAGRSEPDKFKFAYNFDGSESETETPIRTPDGLVNVPTTLKLVTGADGKLQITITRKVTMPDRTFKGVTVEDWELSADGKILTIHRTDETPRGKMQADMVFVKNY